MRTHRMLCLALLTALALSACNDTPAPCTLEEPNTANPYSNDDEIDEPVKQEMCDQGIYGLAIGIVKDGAPIYLKGYGYEDLGNEVQVESHETMFRWASLSKSVTGVAAALAHVYGEMDLDADIRAYVPEYEIAGNIAYEEDPDSDIWTLEPLSSSTRLSTRMLVTNTGGFKHYSDGISSAGTPPAELRNDPNENAGIQWAAQYVWDDTFHMNGRPGQAYNYSSYGFNTGGVAIGRAVGSSYWEWVRDEIAVPMGIAPAWSPLLPADGYESGTWFQPDYEWVDIPRRAVGYTFDEDQGTYEKEGSSDVSWKVPSGGFISTVEHLAKYCGGVMTNDSGVTDEIRDDYIWKKGELLNGDEVDYAMGFIPSSRNGRPLVWHNGAQQKTRTHMYIYPEDGLCFVVMTNSDWASTTGLVQALEDAYRAKKLPMNGGVLN